MTQDRETFTKVAKRMGDKVGENPAALRTAVFLLSAKNPRGGGVQTPPPPSRAKVNPLLSGFISQDIFATGCHMFATSMLVV